MGNIRSSDGYATFVVGFAIMTDSMIYTLVLPFLPHLFSQRLHVPENDVSQWTALAFEVFAVTSLLFNVVAGSFADASASKSKPFMVSILIMLISTLLFFLGTTPAMVIISRAIQGASTTFTWVTGLAFLVAQVGEGDLGAYVGWTTVGVAVGEIVGPLVGGPIYDYLGHWAAFGVVEALLLVDILLRLFVKQKESVEDAETGVKKDKLERDSETDALLQAGQEQPADNKTMDDETSKAQSSRSTASSLALNWLGTVFTLIIIFMIRGALEVAVPLYLIRQYSWSSTKISLALLTLLLPGAVNPVVGKYTSRQGPRWWSTGAFAVCGVAMISFGSVAGPSQQSQTLFVIHSAVVGIALAVLVNSNQVAMSVAAQRYGPAIARAKETNQDLGRVLSWLSPGMMLSGVTTSWAVGILFGPAYSSLIDYTTDAGWAFFCHGLGCISLVAAVASTFLWRKW